MLFSKDPIQCSMGAMVVSFVVLAIIFALVKPKFVTKIDVSSGKRVVAVDRLLSYAGLISVVIGLVVVGVCSLKKDKQASLPMSFGRASPQRLRRFGMGESSCGCN